MTTTPTRPELPPPPTRIAALPVDRRGYPVPWFVEWVNDEPDHRVMDGTKLKVAWARSLCWICGQPLGGPTVTFTIGPMCAVNRVSAEPPSHHECSLYSVKACPFMSRPHARRRDHDYPAGHVEAAGIMLHRNPGVTLVWEARRHTCGPFQAPGGSGWLFHIGTPASVEWWAAGQPATREQVLASIESGLPALAEHAREQGPDAERSLQDATAEALTLLPAA